MGFIAPASAAELSAAAAASWNSNRYDLMVRGDDGLIYHKYWNGSAWSNWGSIGAPPVGAASSPAVTAPAANNLQVFVRGGDNRIWINYWLNGTGSAPGGWSGWGAIPNTGNATWAPAATYGADGQVDVFYTGTDKATYYTRHIAGVGWTYPVSLGGESLGSPGATTTAGGRMQIIVRGSDSGIYLKYADNPLAWTGWGMVPGAATSMSPALTTGDEGQVNMFFRHLSNGTMFHEYFSPSAGWIGPGAIPNVGLLSSPAAARLHVYYRDGAGNVLGTYYDPVAGWVYPSSKGQPVTNKKLVREQNSLAVFYVVDGARFWITSPEVANAMSLNLNTVEVLPDGSLGAMPRGPDITMASLEEGGEIPDPNSASTAGTGWKSAWGDTDDNFDFKSGDGRVRAIGTLQWFYGWPKVQLHKGLFSSSSWVHPYGAVPCIWASVRWGYPLGSVSFPPSGTISGAEERSDMFVKCRANGAGAPDAIPLYGLGFAKGQLAWGTLTICSSNSRDEGPRFCSNHKMSYPALSP